MNLPKALLDEIKEYIFYTNYLVYFLCYYKIEEERINNYSAIWDVNDDNFHMYRKVIGLKTNFSDEKNADVLCDMIVRECIHPDRSILFLRYNGDMRDKVRRGEILLDVIVCAAHGSPVKDCLHVLLIYFDIPRKIFLKKIFT